MRAEKLILDNKNLVRFLKYLEFKFDCAAYQEQHPVRFDREKALSCLKELRTLEVERINCLKEVMPKVPKYVVRNKPKNTHKKDGTLSVAGERWFKTLKDAGLPVTHNDPVKVISHYEEPNPGSHVQEKGWLFSLGWKPCTFKYVKEEDGSERKIPQVRQNGELTPSVKVLAEKEPAIKKLEDLALIQHRISVFESLVNNCFEKDGKYYVRALIHGITNTLRFKHKVPLVNLPGVDKPWGKEIRGCLLAEEGEYLVGADMVSLEATTKRHYIYPFDPDYADEMGKEGFDEHLDLALRNGELSKEDYDFYVNYQGGDEERYERIHKIRKSYKPVNYAAVYGIGVKHLCRTTGMPEDKAANLLDAYWSRNWAVRKCVEGLNIKESHGYLWLQNPLSGFWHELRADKDRFSTLNQSTGVYLFDSWLARCARMGYMGQFQFHDETGGTVKDKEETRKILERAIHKLNEDFKGRLNVEMKVDIKFGSNYAEVH